MQFLWPIFSLAFCLSRSSYLFKQKNYPQPRPPSNTSSESPSSLCFLHRPHIWSLCDCMSPNICPALRCSTETLHYVWSQALSSLWQAYVFLFLLPDGTCQGASAFMKQVKLQVSHHFLLQPELASLTILVYPKGPKQSFLWSVTSKAKTVRSEVPLPDVSTVVKRMEDTGLAAQLQLCWDLTHLLLHFVFAVIAELIWTIWLLPSSNSHTFSAYFLVIASALFWCLSENICPEDSPLYNLFKICHHLLTLKISSLIPSLVTGPSMTSHFVARCLSRNIHSFASHHTVLCFLFRSNGLFSV